MWPSQCPILTSVKFLRLTSHRFLQPISVDMYQPLNDVAVNWMPPQSKSILLTAGTAYHLNCISLNHLYLLIKRKMSKMQKNGKNDGIIYELLNPRTALWKKTAMISRWGKNRLWFFQLRDDSHQFKPSGFVEPQILLNGWMRLNEWTNDTYVGWLSGTSSTRSGG